jgi:hypothetical protein
MNLAILNVDKHAATYTFPSCWRIRGRDNTAAGSHPTRASGTNTHERTHIRYLPSDLYPSQLITPCLDLSLQEVQLRGLKHSLIGSDIQWISGYNERRMFVRAVRYRADVEERVDDAALASYTSSSTSGNESEHDGTYV